MNMINIDFEREKNDIKWSIITLIYSILFLFGLILIIIFRVKNKIEYDSQLEEEENIIKEIIENIYKDKQRKREQIKTEENPLKSEDIRITQEKSNSPDVKEEMTVIFQSPDEKEMIFPITCKRDLIFNQVEKLLYEKVPKYKETNNIFLCNGKPINKIKTLEENNIKHRQIISIICEGNIIKDN